MRGNNGGRRRGSEYNRRETSDVPGYGRIGGIDDPVSRAEYGDDRETGREQAEADAAAHDRREELLGLSTKLRGDIRSYYDGEIGAAGFVRRLRSLSNELDRHAESIESCDEDGDTQ